MDILVGTSLVAAFIAGLAALFAPCCITVLLPSYLGSIFRERRKVFIMTFIFFGRLSGFSAFGLGLGRVRAASKPISQRHFYNRQYFLVDAWFNVTAWSAFSLPFQVNPTLKTTTPFPFSRWAFFPESPPPAARRSWPECWPCRFCRGRCFGE